MTVVTILRDRNGFGFSDANPAEVVLHLAQHGIQATSIAQNLHHGSVADALLARAANADLLVVGGYAHSRFREWVVGGVTRDLLREMTVPVLMSH